jgi:5'-phosphate synthase pdxT subunit
MKKVHRIGILALQGGFAEHAGMLRRLGAETFEIRQAADLERPMDGLVLPGGESTTICKLLHGLGMFAPLKEKLRGGLPAFGTCAGMILLSSRLLGADGVEPLGAIDIEVRRNAYGRQLGSFRTEAPFRGLGNLPMTFIRAPYIEKLGPGVELLAEVGGKMVAARQGRVLVTAFHPELTDDTRLHAYFLQFI